LEAELCVFSHRKKYRVFFIARANSVDDTVGTQYIFLAEHLFGLLVRVVGSDDLPENALAGVLVISAADRVHLRNTPFLIEMWLLARQD
jgi:hypothetical protein